VELLIAALVADRSYGWGSELQKSACGGGSHGQC
jgi:hypothetical protein